jgi:hypothetical protein
MQKSLLQIEFEDTIIEGIITETVLFHYEEFSDNANKTVDFIFTEITIEESFIAFYTMNYKVQDIDYNLTLWTLLTPLNLESYNISFTLMSYEPADKTGFLSMEFVEFNFSTKLSEMYTILGKVAKKIGNVYKKSEDDSLKQLVKAYNTTAKEAKRLSKIVKKELPEYDKPINTCKAFLRDDWVSCFWCNVICEAVILLGLGGACIAFPPFCFVAFLLLDLEAWSAGYACTVYCEMIHWCP